AISAAHAHLSAFGRKLGAEWRAASGDIGELLGLLAHVAGNGLVAVIVPHELERDVLDSLPSDRRPHHRADPVAVLAAAMAGVEGEIAEPIEHRLALVDLHRQPTMTAMAATH